MFAFCGACPKFGQHFRQRHEASVLIHEKAEPSLHFGREREGLARERRYNPCPLRHCRSNTGAAETSRSICCRHISMPIAAYALRAAPTGRCPDPGLNCQDRQNFGHV